MLVGVPSTFSPCVDVEPMRILFITRKFPPSVGGMETLAKGLADHLPEVAEVKLISWGGKHIVLLPFVFVGFFFRMLRQIFWADVILLGDAVLAPLGWWARVVHRKRVVCVLHGLDLRFPFPLYRLWRKLFSYGFSHYICNSHTTEREALRLGYHPLTVIPPGIEVGPLLDRSLARARLSELGSEQIPPSAFLLGFLGRASKRKGLAWFLEYVFPFLPETIHLAIAGSSSLADIFAALPDVTLRSRVHFLGRISDADRDLFLAGVDLFLMPNIPVSGDQEGFGIVAIEASVRGTPVLASDLEGLQDAVLQNKMGWLLPPGDANSYIAFLKNLLTSPGKQSYATVAALTRETTLEIFSWTRIVQGYARVFSDATPAWQESPAPQNQ